MSDAHGHELTFVQKYVFSQDHKVIGMQYLITGLLMLIIGVFLSYVFRFNLAFPGENIPLFGELVAKKYNEFVTMHGTIMIFWVAMPVLVAAFGNLLIPLMVGYEDMAFPWLNMLSYWIFLFSTIVLISSFFVTNGSFDGGWTAYPPLSANAYKDIPFLDSLGGTLWLVAVALEFVAFLMGGINFIVTTFNCRAKGLSWYRLPITVWMFLLAILDFMFSVGPLLAGCIMLLMDRTLGTGFYNPAVGGDPVLFQHMFWFFGHPEVYVLLFPALGFVAEIITTFARKTMFAYKAIIWSSIVASILAFVVWAHHQFISGIDPRMATFFAITTIIISIPFAINIISYIATLYKGSIVFTTQMLFALGFLVTFLVGGITGIYLGSSAFDIYAHDTYFVIAHFHYTMIPIVIFGSFAGIYHWYPKFIGRLLNPTLGKIHFWFTFIGFNLIFLPLFINGLCGQHRRIFNYSSFPDLMSDQMMSIRVLATSALIFTIIGQIPFIYNLFSSVKKGEIAGDNPWNSNSLEWATSSPPPHLNFKTPPEVFRGPYEYSHPDRESDFWPQNEK